MAGESPFGYSLKYNTSFIVKNTTGYTDAEYLAEGIVIPSNARSPQKTVSVFDYPILAGQTRDLLQIPGVCEEDIRVSLLKGVLRHKFLCGDIYCVFSDINLLQFNADQTTFLTTYNINNGVAIGYEQLDGYLQSIIGSGGGVGVNYDLKYDIHLIGMQDGSNRVFYLPDIFIEGLFMGNEFHIEVFHNGRRLLKGSEFTISESGGVGTGYNTVNFKNLVPISSSTLRANYAVKI